MVSVADGSLEPWVEKALAHPVTKSRADRNGFPSVNGVIDARVFLRNSYGFNSWSRGQSAYEEWDAGGEGHNHTVAKYKAEIDYDRPVYSHFRISGDVLDVGGHVGTLREFLDPKSRFVSVDPYIEAPHNVVADRIEAYSCLTKRLNFIGAMAEFLPFRDKSFDWVHMRSMLDHVQIPDLAMLEAQRVLKDDGNLLIGLWLEGGREGKEKVGDALKHNLIHLLGAVGFKRFEDHHMWHPTLKNLEKLISDNGLAIADIFWQPHWNGRVAYVRAGKIAAG